MSTTKFISGLSGALGLYSGVKGLFDAADSARKQRKLVADGRAAESAWYRRNYYGDYLNDSMARAAMKRVENTLRRQGRQNRAYAAVNGATNEYSIARNSQGMSSLENVVSGIAAQQDSNRRRVDAMHLQNMNTIRNGQMNELRMDEQAASSASVGGFNLLNNALMAVNWGKEK